MLYISVGWVSRNVGKTKEVMELLDCVFFFFFFFLRSARHAARDREWAIEAGMKWPQSLKKVIGDGGSSR